MTQTRTFEIFCAVPPGLEPVLAGEMSELGWTGLRPEPGGVCFDGGWADVWRANLWLRGASRVLARIDRFRVVHLSQLPSGGPSAPERTHCEATRRDPTAPLPSLDLDDDWSEDEGRGE